MDATPLTRLDNCPAPAKLNLFLHVVGRRADGYHLLQSAFRMLDWSDTLSFALREDGLVRRVTEVPGVPEEQDLVVRAARLLQQATGTRLGADITIDKVLPMGGGLGGGSSDAATALIALNRLWKTGFDREALAQLGLRLGADVPFFIFGHDAFVEGIGEKMQPIELPPAWYVVVAPPVTVPTAEIFSSRELTRNTEPVNIAVFAASATRNDLQAVACKLYPEVGAAIDWLAQFAPTRMTGSGACVFAEVGGEMEADEIVKSCPTSFRAWKAKSLTEHPLTSWID
ncbi:MAG TPA: 4-(cytidine 5'-diphospho)-2-C-methyl-D-erythritol kinase [Aromatoleum sp.]|uniref:4-(cytidine 5'-diphospho)-2-C-methyl-D-erythritol kinase n=1 Tax=Aromatoleum sp. TaxID=2307007 RepID=UPI002B46C0EC|nr:4-(cytidine 5'-diphospho)-2-C-methyl-D-erythritol kinase [Aromatoleum sp.]HJV28695.1 4-(cytidine 5'-diphospho)-2-C-methyl-D-erythritol kinase [Aromatoleum sp.]